MSLRDKIDNKAEELGGKAKEAAGKITDDQDLEAEGKGDQLSAGLKDAAEDVKDAVSGAVGKVKKALGND
ncbi:CsbD family protein [Nocardia sp. NPDC003693]